MPILMTLKEITQRYGTRGIQDLKLLATGKAEITDDTQMTLFIAEGILRSERAYLYILTYTKEFISKFNQLKS